MKVLLALIAGSLWLSPQANANVLTSVAEEAAGRDMRLGNFYKGILFKDAKCRWRVVLLSCASHPSVVDER